MITFFSVLRGHQVPIHRKRSHNDPKYVSIFTLVILINGTRSTYLILRSPRNFHPRNLHFRVRFPFITHFGVQRLPWNWYQNVWNFLVRFWPKGKVCWRTPIYPSAFVKISKGIFVVQFPGNLFEFSIILNDFWSSFCRFICLYLQCKKKKKD